jgi:hypothetical protein
MFVLMQDSTTIDVVEDNVKFIGLIGKSSIIIKHIWLALAPHPQSHPDGLGGRVYRGENQMGIIMGGYRWYTPVNCTI